MILPSTTLRKPPPVCAELWNWNRLCKSGMTGLARMRRSSPLRESKIIASGLPPRAGFRSRIAQLACGGGDIVALRLTLLAIEPRSWRTMKQAATSKLAERIHGKFRPGIRMMGRTRFFPSKEPVARLSKIAIRSPPKFHCCQATRPCYGNEAMLGSSASPTSSHMRRKCQRFGGGHHPDVSWCRRISAGQVGLGGRRRTAPFPIQRTRTAPQEIPGR